MGDSNRPTRATRDVVRALATAMLAGPLLALGCGSTASLTPEERRASAESECRAVAEHGLRARPPSPGVQDDIYRQCMEKKGLPTPR